MAELLLNKYTEKTQNESNLSITNTNNDMNIELNKEFLTELQSNAYHEIHHEYVVDHIAMINEGEGKITTWEELVEKFFFKFYPKSYDEEDEMLDQGNNWGIDPLEFLSRVNSSFENHRKVDRITKKPYLKTGEKNDVEREGERSRKKRKCINSNLEDKDLTAKKSTKLVKYQSSGILCVIVVMLEFRCIYNTHPCS
ncbi:hypothetical protein Tco_0787990 [Tanacetum coccineum]